MAASAPAATAAVQQAAPAPAAGARGDVEKPPEVAPSAIRRVLPPPAAGQAPQFSAPGPRPGGSAATQYRASLNYFDQEGVVIGNGLKRYQGRLNANHDALSGKLRLGLNLMASRVKWK